MTSRYDYLRTPAEIYASSHALVAAETDLSGVPAAMHQVVLRLVHACAMPDIVSDLAWRRQPVAAAQAALRVGAPVLADCRMVAEGIIRSRLPADNAVICTLDDIPAAPHADTRSAAAVELWRPHLNGAVVAIGNAPTALFRLLEMLETDSGIARPAAILAFPVGFVGAAESKEALCEAELTVPFITLRGRRGGSAMAASAVNALCGAFGE